MIKFRFLFTPILLSGFLALVFNLTDISFFQKEYRCSINGDVLKYKDGLEVTSLNMGEGFFTFDLVLKPWSNRFKLVGLSEFVEFQHQ